MLGFHQRLNLKINSFIESNQGKLITLSKYRGHKEPMGNITTTQICEFKIKIAVTKSLISRCWLNSYGCSWSRKRGVSYLLQIDISTNALYMMLYMISPYIRNSVVEPVNGHIGMHTRPCLKGNQRQIAKQIAWFNYALYVCFSKSPLRLFCW